MSQVSPAWLPTEAGAKAQKLLQVQLDPQEFTVRHLKLNAACDNIIKRIAQPEFPESHRLRRYFVHGRGTIPRSPHRRTGEPSFGKATIFKLRLHHRKTRLSKSATRNPLLHPAARTPLNSSRPKRTPLPTSKPSSSTSADMVGKVSERVLAREGQL